MSAGTPQFIQQFPSLRMRRMRRDEFSRRLMRETSLAADNFIYPVFVQDGTNKRHAVPSMPGVERHTIDKLFEVAEKFVAYCGARNLNPVATAVAWVGAHPGVTAPIIGPRTLEQLDGSTRALEIKLSDETLKKLDEIWPGPGGPAPEAYAW